MWKKHYPCCKRCLLKACVSIFLQEDIEEVSRVARQVKNRLERLDKINEQSLSRKVPTKTKLFFLT